MKKALLFSIFSISFFTSFAQSKPDTIEIKQGIFGNRIYSYKGDRLQTLGQFEIIMSGTPGTDSLLLKSRSNSVPAFILGAAGGGMIGWPIGGAIAGAPLNVGLLAAGAIVTGISIPFSSAMEKNKYKAVLVFNEAQKKK